MADQYFTQLMIRMIDERIPHYLCQSIHIYIAKKRMRRECEGISYSHRYMFLLLLYKFKQHPRLLEHFKERAEFKFKGLFDDVDVTGLARFNFNDEKKFNDEKNFNDKNLVKSQYDYQKKNSGE